MKDEISSIELRHILRELGCLSGAKVDKIYEPERYELLFQLHQRGMGKSILRVVAGKYLYLSATKGEQPTAIHGFCQYLRKHLAQATLASIEQVGSERIVRMVFETRTGRRNLYVEFFMKGNIVLCDDKDIILSPLDTQVWTDRTVKAKVPYEHPHLSADLFSLSRRDLDSGLASSTQPTLVKALAVGFGMGGVYAEEACLLAAIEKTAPPKGISRAQADLLFEVIMRILSSATEAYVVRVGDAVHNVVPFRLFVYDSPHYTLERHPSYCEALDAVCTTSVDVKHEAAATKVKLTEEDRVQRIIDAQEKQAVKMEKDILECQRKGELIYENFAIVEDILSQVNKARKSMSWSEIKAKLKGHKVVKEIDEKTGKIVIDV